MTTLHDLMQGGCLSALSTEDLRALNAEVCRVLKSRQTSREAHAAAKIELNQRYSFTTRQGRTVIIVVDKVNVKTVKGRQINADGTIGSMTWTVSPSLLSPIS